jgi:hypothetical protein
MMASFREIAETEEASEKMMIVNNVAPIKTFRFNALVKVVTLAVDMGKRINASY